MTQDYTAPGFGTTAFNCPRCDAYAQQVWGKAGLLPLLKGVVNKEMSENLLTREPLWVCFCGRCQKYSLWIYETLIYPSQITAPTAHRDMPASVLEYYNEAREVSTSSARAATALLRIAAKKLCEELGESEPNLNRAIGNLHKKGLPKNVIKSLDTVRIVGNEGGAHAGQIDLTGADNKEIVGRLFWLVNFIVEKTISEPAEVEKTFQSLPDDKKKGIKIRDAKTVKKTEK